MKPKSNALVLIASIILALLCVLTAVFWDSIIYLIAPKVVLNQALSQALSQLEERFHNSPLHILENTFDPDGKYTADMHLETVNKLLGGITYDMTVQTDAAAHRLEAAGTVGLPTRDLDLKLYLDEHYMAVSSEALVGGSYYGLTFDTFIEDIRRIPLLGSVVPNAMLNKWDQSLQTLQEQMQKDYVLPRIPDITQKEFRSLLMLITALPCQIDSAAIHIDGSVYPCRRFSYQASGEVLNLLLSSFPNSVKKENGAAEVSLYLAERALVRVEISCETGTADYFYKLDLGQAPDSGDLTFYVAQTEDGQTNTLQLSVRTEPGDTLYYEKWKIRRNTEASQYSIDFSYDWEPATGNLTLRSDAREVSLRLEQRESGFRIRTDDFSTLLNMITQNGDTPLKFPSAEADLSIARGSGIPAPEYKNISQWSLADFLELVNSIGALFGISI